MSTHRDDQEGAPHVVVALPEGPLRERILALLSGRELNVDTLAPPAQLGERIERSSSDLVIVRREDLSEADRERLDAIAGDRGAPDVVVVGPELDDADTVELVQAGATDAIDSNRLDARAGDKIETLAAGEGGHTAPEEARDGYPALSDFASHSKAMHALVDLVQRVAPTDSALLIQGETGVGKEHLARAVHAISNRREGPFVAVNCGALPTELLESELFGHAAGAFTGAKGTRKGFFQSADGGSLLLDEIGEMPHALQVKLLRVLQRGDVRPVGADTDVAVDVRIMAATNRDLRAEVAAGSFREDLFFRLNVVELVIPPLRDRPEDLPVLVGSLLRHFREQMGVDGPARIDDKALEALLRYAWPGNVRELLNALERAMLVCEDGVIRASDLPAHVARRRPDEPATTAPWERVPAELLEMPWKEARAEVLRGVERAYLHALLEACGGVIGDTAERAGLSNRSLYEKMRRHGLNKEDYR